MKHTYKAAILAAATLTLAAPAVGQDNSAAGVPTTAGNTASTTATTDPMATTETNAMRPTETPANISDPMMANTTGTDPMMMEYNTTNESYTRVQREEGNDFPWGLLGLLGLAGLLGRKKREASDIHVDARQNNRT